jgi:membrane-bound lytic murein transglycosylase MltF
MPQLHTGIAETDSYVRKILSNAGQPPAGADSDQLVQWLLPHVIHQESGGDPTAVSPKGALGRLQVMPATADNPGFGIEPAKDHSPEELERVGKSYLKAMLDRYPGRPDLALAAYNAGPGRADKWANVTAAQEGGRPDPFA